MIDFFELRENYRALAVKGMGTESKKDARVGLELDYYDGSGTKRSGKITKVGPKSYIVKDDKDGKNRQFLFHDRAKAKELLAKNESVEESVKTEDKGQFIYAAKQAKAKGDSTFVFAGKTYNCEEVLDELSPIRRPLRRRTKGRAMKSKFNMHVVVQSNAVKRSNEIDTLKTLSTCCESCAGETLVVEESEYQGKKVKLNNPFRTPDGPKKFSVYVKNDKGNVVKVNFGDPNMEIKRDDPNRRKSFRARHNCDNPGLKWKARYWSCYQWRSGAKVDN